ncbi:MAG: ATP-dependent zinc metalloprotease FtsH [Alphaproteobacteria bacterium]|nr:ATP-dependent zinc metalloprotease FtsH [Alphaproteobacteria bacterium]
MKNEKNLFKKKDGSKFYLIAFIVLFVALIARMIFLGGLNNGTVKDGLVADAAVQKAPIELSFSDVLRRVNDIKTMDIHKDDVATGLLKDGTPYRANITYNPELLEKISSNGATVSIDNSDSMWDGVAKWLPILVSALFLIWLLRIMRGGSGGGGGLTRSLIGQNPTKITTGKTKTTFKDVAGIDAEKQELMEVVDFLKNKDKYKSLGARVPRGILLSGEPGTGKTLLARAVAGEANVPFFATSGSDFSGIIVGLGVAKIKEIFELAKRNAPCILFMDEIDAIGQSRSKHTINDNDREQTLNQLLIEMDGFANDTGIIVIAATNRPDMLDAALLRPGRFDRQIYIELPNLEGRRDILELHAKKFKIDENVSLMDVARGTTGFSGADLENLLNEAALHAVHAEHKVVEQSDLEEARDKVLMGPKKNRKMRPEDIKLTAYHEAGHAFVGMHYSDITDPIHKATIVPRGRALGMVQHLPIDDKVSMSLDEIRANLSVFLAGRATEEIFFGANKITTGAESDIAMATQLARRSITTAGLSDKIGLVAVNQVNTFGQRVALENASEKTAEVVDSEIRSWVDNAYKDAKNLVSKNKATVDKLAKALLDKETLTGEEIREIVFGKNSKKTPKKTVKKIVKKTNAKK